MSLNRHTMDDEADLLITYKPKVYSFQAICTSDKCMGKAEKGESVTYIGVVKPGLNKTQEWCPHCSYALFWEKREVA